MTRILGVMVVMVFALPQQSLTKNQRNASMVPVVQREQDFKLTALAESVTEVQATDAADANARLAISIWHDLNAMCRGYSGDRPETQSACCVRERVSSLLNNLGYCYHMGEVWKKCRPGQKPKARASQTSCMK
jgi:hypothetical protein